jgi:hypothetical protein
MRPVAPVGPPHLGPPSARDNVSYPRHVLFGTLCDGLRCDGTESLLDVVAISDAALRVRRLIIRTSFVLVPADASRTPIPSLGGKKANHLRGGCIVETLSGTRGFVLLAYSQH